MIYFTFSNSVSNLKNGFICATLYYIHESVCVKANKVSDLYLGHARSFTFGSHHSFHFHILVHIIDSSTTTHTLIRCNNLLVCSLTVWYCANRFNKFFFLIFFFLLNEFCFDHLQYFVYNRKYDPPIFIFIFTGHFVMLYSTQDLYSTDYQKWCG